MARKGKSKSRRKSDPSPVFSYISEETLNTIFGIIFTVVSVFLLLGAFNIAGKAGEVVYGFLTYLFGVGYYILILALLLLSIAFFQSKERNFAIPQTIGSILFFISGLGLTDLLLVEQGGVIGALISKPLNSLFDVYASTIILVAILLVSMLVIFDTSFKSVFLSMRNRILGEKEATENLGEGESVAVEKAVESLAGQDENREPAVKTFSTPKSTRDGDDEFVGLSAIFKRKSGKEWTPPPLSLLDKDSGKPGVGDIKANANLIKRTLMNFGIVVEMDEISIGPSVTRYALKPAEGVKLSKILGLQTNLELALAAHPVRIEAPIPGKSLVGIEVPNITKATIGLGSLISEGEYSKSEKALLVALGRDISGKSHFANMAKMPHLLIAGATGSGKSVTIHAIINSLLFRNPPDNLKFIMIDPKRVELTLYNNIPHLLTPVITDAKKAILSLKWVTKEMDRRYDVLQKSAVRDIDSYHKNILSKQEENNDDPIDPMPYIVVIIDELADLMQAYPRELEASIVRLAQMSRAVGIHLLLSTQRPSVNVITGLIKANVPARIALQVSSQIDSRTILDATGAEKLLGSGDMLYSSGEMSKPVRIQSAFIKETEVKKVTKYLKDNYADELQDELNLTEDTSPNAIFSSTISDEDEDELYEDARQTVIEAGKASTSFLQRKLRIGYARAARLIDILEEKGVIGPGDGAKPRDVLVGQVGGDSIDES